MAEPIESSQNTDNQELTSLDMNREVPLNRIIPEDLPIEYSDGMVVKVQDGMFMLYFFQSHPPLAVTQEEINAIEQIDSLCIAQILITPNQMKKNLDVLNGNFQRFSEEIEALKKQLQDLRDEKSLK